MADVGKGLISKIIDDNDIQTAIAAGIRASWFEDEENRSVFSFMLDYHSRYGKTATAQALKDEYPNYRLRTTNEPYEYYIDRIFVQHERAILSDTVIEASAALEQDDIKLSRDALSRGLQRLGLETSILSDVNVVETYRDRYEDYLEAREHVGELSGISTGFPTLDMLTGGFQDEQFVVLGGAPKQGKAGSIYSNVLTPLGWRRMGDLKIGDRVIGSNGKAVTVRGVWDWGVRPTFRVTTDDGASTLCSAEHEWEVLVRCPSDNRRRVVETAELKDLLLNGERSYYLPVVAPVEFSSVQPLPLHPYLMGALLGDGGLTESVSFHKPYQWFMDEFSSQVPSGVMVKNTGRHISLGAGRGHPNPVKKALQSLGIFGLKSSEKFIPLEYLHASVDERMALLRGLMDTDGGFESNAARFSTSSPRLAEDFVELARSLGGITHSTLRMKTKYQNGFGLPGYRINVRLPASLGSPFKWPVKAEQWANGKKKRVPTRRIVSVEPSGTAPVRCITVEAPDGLYVTEDFMVTHNSFMLMEMAIGAQFANCKVLFVSFEMSKREQLARYDASTCGVNASHLLRGTTTDKELKKLRKEMALRKHMQPFIISTDISATTTVSGLAAKVEEHDPDIVFVDGLYLMDNEIGAEPGSPRAFTAISRSLKRLAQRLKMPIVGTTQALTGKMKGNEVTMHSLGWCVDTKTEILTSTGWKTYETLEAGDLAFTLNHDSGRSEWQPVESVQVFAAEQRRMISMQSGSGAGHSSLTTPNHRWPVEHRTNHSIKGVVNRATGRRWATTETLLDNDQLILCGPHGDIPDAAKYTDSFVELVAWYWTEGSLMNDYGSVSIYQSFDINPGNSARIRSALLNEFGDIRPTTGAGKRLGHLEPPAWREDERKGGFFYLNVSAGRLLMDVVAGYEKVVSWDFLRTLTQAQLELFIQVSLLGDRTSAKSLGQASKARAESFQFACILAGRATSMTETVHKGYSSGPKWTTYVRNRERCAPVRAAKLQQAFKIETVQYDGVIWCPVTANQTWFARRCGSTYFTGNTSAWSQDADLILGTAKEDSGLLRFSVVAGRQVSSYDIPIAVNWDTSEFLEGNMEGESGGDSEDED
jgi:replicative DNA helicase